MYEVKLGHTLLRLRNHTHSHPFLQMIHCLALSPHKTRKSTGSIGRRSLPSTLQDIAGLAGKAGMCVQYIPQPELSCAMEIMIGIC